MKKVLKNINFKEEEGSFMMSEPVMKRGKIVLTEYEKQKTLWESAQNKTAAAGMLRPSLSLDISDKIWINILETENLTFAETMEILTTGLKTVGMRDDLKQGLEPKDKTTFPLRDLSEMLGRRGEPWKKWFTVDCRDVYDDVGDEIPDWIMQQPLQDRTLKPDEFTRGAHFTDRLFIDNPWRRYYVWTRALRRTCSKTLGMYLTDDAYQSKDQISTVLEGIRPKWGVLKLEPVMLTKFKINGKHDEYIEAVFDKKEVKPPIFKQQLLWMVVWPDIGWLDPWKKTGKLKLLNVSPSSPFLLWLYIRANDGFDHIYPEVTFAEYIFDEVGFDFPVVNFDYKIIVLSYMLWYLEAMVKKNTLSGKYLDLLKLTENGESILDSVKSTPNNRRIISQTGSWLALDRLPLAPRRLKFDERTKEEMTPYWHSTLFLGDEALENDNDVIQRCSRCKTQTYNSREEQVVDWPQHKLECVEK